MTQIPENTAEGSLTRAERIDIIVQTLLRGFEVCTSINLYGGGKIMRRTYRDPKTKKTSSWYETVDMANCPDTRYTEEVLFRPAYDEVMEALDQFKAKGWHAYHDREMDSYKVCIERYARGEYADRQTTWLF